MWLEEDTANHSSYQSHAVVYSSALAGVSCRKVNFMHSHVSCVILLSVALG